MPKLFDIAKPLLERGTNLATSAFGTAAGQAGGLAKRLRGGGGGSTGGGGQPAGVADATLKSQVESALYRLPGVTRSKVKVTVAEGTVTLHGEARNQAQMSTIETAVTAVPGVTGYESQLHLPKTPAPSTPAAGRKQATRKKPAATTKAAARGRTERVNRDKTTDAATAAGADPEKKPVEMAAKGEPRQAAPMGSTDPDAEKQEPGSTGTAGTPGTAGSTGSAGSDTPTTERDSAVTKVKDS
jgi:BON domain-containing protein